MKERLAVFWQYCLPKLAISALFGCLARSRRFPRLRHWIIERYVHFYQVDLSIAEREQISDYQSFNDFFTRRLKANARPLCQQAGSLIMPVDGSVSQLGPIAEQQILQAKGHTYQLSSLLAADPALSDHFRNGSFITLYLSPRDYHRIHMPLAGTLQQMVYVPGELFSVNPTTVQGVPGVFARNERVICLFETELGRMALILVGALIVGSVQTVWAGQVNPPRPGKINRWHYEAEQAISFKRGEEMGAFQLGSTVIALFEPDRLRFAQNLLPGQAVQMGELLAFAR